MINIIRNTVLSILSKENRGYITPEEFNLFSRQAQLDIFTKYMYDYSLALAKQSARMYGTDYADVPELLHEIVDRFLVENALQYDNIQSKFYMPGDDPSQPSEPRAYKVIRLTYDDITDIEKESPAKIRYRLNSNKISPTEDWPVYVLDENGSVGDAGIQVYPTTITTNVTITYIRYPKDPKWTWQLLSSGEALFDQSQSDFQDFELPLLELPRLIVLICKYAGVSIREAEVVQVMQNDEAMDAQQKA